MARQEARHPCPLQPAPTAYRWRRAPATPPLQPCQQPIDLRPQLKGVEIDRHRLDPLTDPRHRDRLATTHSVSIMWPQVSATESLDRLVGCLLDHGLVISNAFHAAGRGDRAVDRHLPGELRDRSRHADVEQDGATGSTSNQIGEAAGILSSTGSSRRRREPAPRASCAARRGIWPGSGTAPGRRGRAADVERDLVRALLQGTRVGGKEQQIGLAAMLQQRRQGWRQRQRRIAPRAVDAQGIVEPQQPAIDVRRPPSHLGHRRRIDRQDLELAEQAEVGERGTRAEQERDRAHMAVSVSSTKR